MEAAIADVRRFLLVFNVLKDDLDVFECLMQLLATHPGSGKQVHDANLVATMLTHGIARLLTFNGSDFRRFGDIVEIISP